MSEPDIRKVVSELEEMLRRGVDHIDCDASDIRVLLSALSEAETTISDYRLEWERGNNGLINEVLRRLTEAKKERDEVINDLVAALESIDSEMDDTDHNFATRMFRAGEIIDAALTRASSWRKK